MNKRPVPDIETFRKTVQKYRGHKSNIAASFGVERHTLKKWLEERPEYAEIVEDARGRMFDDTIENAWLFANGIKDIQDGKFVGWLERPDGNTLRYLMGTLGREEGFGERIEVDTNVKPIYYPKDPQDASDYLEFMKMKHPDEMEDFLRRFEETC